LGVQEKTIELHGAVSEACAKEMALCGAKHLKSVFSKRKVLCVSTTGIAGPSGGSTDKPVGLCFVGVSAGSPESTIVEEIRARPGFERVEYQRWFSQKALDLLRTQGLKEMFRNH
jgi:PncC family amidohydrolase